MDAAVIRRVLALRKQSVLLDSRTGVGDVLRVLVRNALAALLVLFGILGGPPIAQVAVSVELPSLIVEAMREFVANHHPDRAVIHRVIQVLLEKWRLQNAGGKVDRIQLRIVV